MLSLHLLLLSLFAFIAAAVALPAVEYSPRLDARLLFSQIPTSPEKDAFYKAPADLSKYAPGDIIRDRPVTTADWFLGAASIYQVLYRTTDALGKPDVTVATLFKPRKPAAGKAKVWTIAVPSDSSTIQCQPSYSFIEGSLSKARGAGLPQIFAAVMDIALLGGQYIIMPDYVGSNAAWLAGWQSGRGTIDGIRAFYNHKPTYTGTIENSGVVMYGYSGGATATAWAGRQLTTYGQGLPIKGIWSGGIPADLTKLIKSNNKSQYAGFLFAAFAGVSNAYPSLETFIKNNWTKAGADFIFSFRNNKCLPDILLGNAGKDIAASALSPDVLESPEIIAALELNSLTYGENRIIPASIPQWISQSKSDAIIPPAQVDSYVADQCAGGANLRYTTFTGPDHISMALNGLGTMLEWTEAAFEGKTGQNGGCTTDAAYTFNGENTPLPGSAARKIQNYAKDSKAGLNFGLW